MGKVGPMIGCLVVEVVLGVVSASCASPTDAACSVPKVLSTPTSTSEGVSRPPPSPAGMPPNAVELRHIYIEAQAKYFAAALRSDSKKETMLLLDEAIREFDMLIQFRDFDAKGEAFVFKGLALIELKKYRQAMRAFDKAQDLVESDGTHGVMSMSTKCKFIWQGRGEALLLSGEDSEAAKALDKAIEIDPDSGRAWKLKGIAHYGLGQYGEARSAFENALRLDPDNLGAQTLLELAEAELKSK